MSELRAKLLELAIQGGATIENALAVARDWEEWVEEEKYPDPLRLGEESPEQTALEVGLEYQYLTHKDCGLVVYVTSDQGDTFDGVVSKRAGSAYVEGWKSSGGYFKKNDFIVPKNLGNNHEICNGNCGTNYCDENGCIDKKEAISPSEPEIDWSKRQLFKNEDGETYLTMGYHDMDCVLARPLYNTSRMSSIWVKKSSLTFHSDLSEEIEWDILLGGYNRPPKKEIDWSRHQLVEDENGLILKVNRDVNKKMFLGEIYPKRAGVSGYEKVCFKRGCVYHGEIPQETKNTGLNFVEAVAIITENEALGMQRTPSSAVFVARKGRFLPLDASHVGNHIEIFLDHFLATDWKIVTV